MERFVTGTKVEGVTVIKDEAVDKNGRTVGLVKAASCVIWLMGYCRIYT